MKIKTNSVKQRTQILNILFAAGYVWHKGLSDETTNPLVVEKNWGWANWAIIAVTVERGDLGGNTSGIFDYDADKDLAKILVKVSKSIQSPAPTKVNSIKLNDSYNADVYSDGSVKVGCQTFVFAAVEGLYNATKKAKQ